MRIFIAGASGAVGRPLVRQLLERGHTVVAMTRSSAKGAELRALGAEVALADALDRDEVVRAVVDAQPDVVVNQLTALESVRKYRNFDAEFELTNRLRTEGTDYLLSAAVEAGAQQFVSQSYTGWTHGTSGGRTKTEDDPFDPDPVRTQRRTLAAIEHLEAVTVEAPNGIALRYGSFYGPGTSIAVDGFVADEVRKRRLPIVGDGAGLWSFIHVDDAAAATVAAIEKRVSGIVNVVDDEPAAARDWIPALAEALGAPPPRHVPVWLARLAAGETGVRAMTRQSGASNAKAKALLDWTPRYPSYREGFRHGLAARPALRRAG
jgi:nucleoside-diphosphate-sugar epimerase